MSEFNFKSSVCTSKEQSERLLSLGLKKETADMVYTYEREEHENNYYWKLDILESPWNSYIWPSNGTFIPAWSLGRLIKDLIPQSIGHLELAVGSDYAGYYEEMYYSQFGIHWEYVEETSDMFDNIISTIEWLIKEGYFNKEYLA